jgi:hypothetical protein
VEWLRGAETAPTFHILGYGWIQKVRAIVYQCDFHVFLQL